jgi:predicted peptidase
MPALSRSWILTLGLLASVPLPIRAEDKKQETGFMDKVFTDKDGKEAKYVVFIPADYKGDKAYPTILFLHGSGESGTDGVKQTKVGLGPVIHKDEKFGFIVVFPQSQKTSWDAGKEDAKRALDILAEVQKNFKVDEKRIYLTGLSLGGMGTWSLAAAYPDKWAAIVPVCGRGDVKTAEKIKNIPCWCFHGDKDGAVNVEGSRTMIDALKTAGASPKYTEYPGVGHNCWDKAYGTTELYEWLLQQKLK